MASLDRASLDVALIDGDKVVVSYIIGSTCPTCRGILNFEEVEGEDQRNQEPKPLRHILSRWSLGLKFPALNTCSPILQR